MEKDRLILEFDDGIAEEYLLKEYRLRHPKEVFWTKKDGSLVNIKDMDDNHLLNAIKLAQRIQRDRGEFYSNSWEDNFYGDS